MSRSLDFKTAAGYHARMIRRTSCNPVWLLLSLTLVLAACEEESSVHPNDPYDIVAASIDGRLLTLDVTYTGSCETHEFTACWSGTYGESLPPFVSFGILHDSNDDACDDIGSQTVHVDLEPFNFLNDSVRLAPAGNLQGQSLSLLYEVTDEPYAPVAEPVLTIETPCPEIDLPF